MDAINNGKSPAHPSEEINFSLPGRNVHLGITKRELFAAMAMQGLCAREDLTSEERSVYAVDNADDLLIELAKARP